MLEKKIKILHEPSEKEPYIVVSKPRGLPSAPLVENEDSVLTKAAILFPEVKSITGRKEVEKGLVHRIDTETEGLVLIASSQTFYDKMISIQNENKFIKKYTALCVNIPNISSKLEGFPPFFYTNDRSSTQNNETTVSFTDKIAINDRSLAKYHETNAGYYEFISTNNRSLIVESRFRYYGKNNSSVRPVTEESGRAALKKASQKNQTLYKTKISISKYDYKNYICNCEITKGFRHQVRCHLSWVGYPVIGDILYNPECKPEDDFRFSATEISFPNPQDNEIKTYSIVPDFLYKHSHWKKKSFLLYFVN